jgi:hypothetical protein
MKADFEFPGLPLSLEPLAEADDGGLLLFWIPPTHSSRETAAFRGASFVQ